MKDPMEEHVCSPNIGPREPTMTIVRRIYD